MSPPTRQTSIFDAVPEGISYFIQECNVDGGAPIVSSGHESQSGAVALARAQARYLSRSGTGHATVLVVSRDSPGAIDRPEVARIPVPSHTPDCAVWDCAGQCQSVLTLTP